MNYEIKQKRGSELLGISLKNIKKRVRKLKEKQGIFPKQVEEVKRKPTPGGPLTEAMIAGMEIVKYGDYVSLDDSLGQQSVSATDFWKETSVDIIIHVRQPFFVHVMMCDTLCT